MESKRVPISSIPYALIPTGIRHEAPAIEMSFSGANDTGKSNFSVPVSSPNFSVALGNSYAVNPVLAQQLLNAFGLTKAQALMEKYGSQASLFLPNRGLEGLDGFAQKISEFRSSAAGQTLGFLSDLSGLIVLGIIVWFTFPILKALRPAVGSVSGRLASKWRR